MVSNKRQLQLNTENIVAWCSLQINWVTRVRGVEEKENENSMTWNFVICHVIWFSHLMPRRFSLKIKDELPQYTLFKYS